MTTTLTQSYARVGGVEGAGFVVLSAPGNRPSADGASLISTSVGTFSFTGGTFSIPVEPGLISVRVVLQGQQFDAVTVTVPVSATPVRLDSLLPLTVVPPMGVALRPNGTLDPVVLAAQVASAVAAAGGGGGGGGATGVVYPFPSAASSWTINHSLGRFPLGVLVVVGTSEVLADVDMPNTSQVVITHAVPTAGRVTLI